MASATCSLQGAAVGLVKHFVLIFLGEFTTTAAIEPDEAATTGRGSGCS